MKRNSFFINHRLTQKCHPCPCSLIAGVNSSRMSFLPLLTTCRGKLKQESKRIDSRLLTAGMTAALLSVFICGFLIYPTAAIGKEKGDDYSIIYKRNIFGVPPPKKEIKSILKLEKIPLSERLLLKGVIVREKGSSLAVIESRETKRENLYKVGDFLLEGEIILIEENRVVIRDKENKEIPLFFAYERGSFVPSKNVVLRPSRKGPKVLRMKKILEDLKAKLPLLSRVRVKPTLISGKVNGYQVTNIPSDSFFETIGIKDGDLIRRINGTQITSIPKAYELYRNLKLDSTVNVDIVRDGKPVTLNYRLE